MLFLLFKCILILCISFVYGWTFLRQVFKKEPTIFHLALYCVIGLIVISTAGNILSLFFPINIYIKTGIILVALLLFLLHFKELRAVFTHYKTAFANTLPLQKLFIFATVGFVLFITALPTLSYDEGLYYIQYIKWIETYPVVPGLANLHHRFGFNSSWHLLSAMFNTSSFTGIEENRINGVIYLLTSLYLLSGLKEENAFLRVFKCSLLVLITLPHMLVYYLIAPNADLVIFYLFSFSITLWLESVLKKQNEHVIPFLVALISIYLLTVKPSAIPVLLLPFILFINWIKQKNYGTILLLCACAIVIITPWLIRNIILTGYVLFPFEKIDLFSFDWKVPAAASAEARRLVKDSAYYLYNDNSVFNTTSYVQKIKIWFLHNVRVYDKAFFAVVVISPLIFLLKRNTLRKKIILLYACLLLGVLFWFVQAPDPRFGYAYIIPIIALSVALFVQTWAIKKLSFMVLISCILLQVATLFIYEHLHTKFLAEKRVGPTANNILITPAPYFEISVTPSPSLIKNPSHGDQCWNAPLPCTYENPLYIQQRGTDLSKGFRAVK